MGSIRTAVPADHAAILEVFSQARAFIASYGSDQWQDGYPEPELISADIEAGVGYVYEDETGIHAYTAIIPGHEPIYDGLQGSWKTDCDQYITIHRLAIDNSCRGKGIGMRIITEAESIARRENLISVRADTHRLNKAMQGLMKKFNYSYCGDVLYEFAAVDPLRICFEKVLDTK